MRKKVLLIDDSVTIHKIVDLTIDRYSFELLSAYDIDEGLSTSSAEAPALILIDNKLFTHTTEDALMELRSGNPNVGIVLLVGAYEHSETELEHTIVDDYIVKPFNSGTLNQVLTDILAKRGEPVEDSQAPEPTIAVIDGLEAVTDTEDIQDGDGEPTMIDISDDEESAPTTEPALPSLDELPDFSNDDLVDTAESLLTLEEPELAAEESDTIDEIVEEPALDDVAEEPVKDVFAASDEPIADELSPEALAAIDSLADEELALEEPTAEADELSLDDLALEEEAAEPADSLDEPSLDDLALEEPTAEADELSLDDLALEEETAELADSLDEPSLDDLALEEPTAEADELSLDDLALEEEATESADLALDEPSLDDLALEEPTAEADELSLDDLALEEEATESADLDEPSLEDLVFEEPTLDDLALAIEEAKEPSLADEELSLDDLALEEATEPADLALDEPSLDDLALEEPTVETDELSLDDLAIEIEEPTDDLTIEEPSELLDEEAEVEMEDSAELSANNPMADMFDMMDEAGDDSPISAEASDPIDEMLDTPAIAPEEDIFSNNQALSQVDNLMLADEPATDEADELEAAPQSVEPKDAVFGENAGVLEGDEREELSTMFNDLNLSTEREEVVDEDESDDLVPTLDEAEIAQPASSIAQPASSNAQPAGSIMAQVTQEVTINQSEPVAKLVLELSKQDLIKLLEASVGKDVLEKIMKEVLQDSISEAVEKLVPNLAEKLVREELKIIKGE